MTEPQVGIFAEDSPHHYFFEYKCRREEGSDAIAPALSEILRIETAASAADQQIVVGFGTSLWAQLAPSSTPQGLRDFAPIEGVRNAPATQADLWIWLQAPTHDRNFDRALQIHRRLQASCALELELMGFIRNESRDLTGFVDGSANPRGKDAKAAALIDEGNAGAGGSFALTQRWVHDLQAFDQLPVPEQEAVIGRTKADSIELEGEAMPSSSHVSRTDAKVDGVAQKIYRRSTPYGSVQEHGLYFVAFACEISRFQVQLERMFGLSEEGQHDRLIEFSTALTGSYWFVPARDALLEALG